MKEVQIMRNMISCYRYSCLLAEKRIAELRLLRQQLKKSGADDEIEKQGLDRRIRLLYSEHQEMCRVIEHLSGYVRSVEERENA